MSGQLSTWQARSRPDHWRQCPHPPARPWPQRLPWTRSYRPGWRSDAARCQSASESIRQLCPAKPQIQRSQQRGRANNAQRHAPPRAKSCLVLLGRRIIVSNWGDVRHARGQLVIKAKLGQLCGQFDRGRDARCVRAAMGFHDRAIQSQKHAAVHPARVNPTFEPLQRGKGQKRGQSRQGRKAEGLPQQVTDQARGAFAGFDGHIAGKAVCHDHIRDVAGDIAPFDKADEIEIGGIGLRANQIKGFLQFGAALVLFGSHIQQPDAGAGQVKPVAGIRRAHQRKAQEVVGIGAHIRAHIQHHVEALGVTAGP
mmetsp:Transcript_2615/g.4482  ORF Transcript_2615/g.4482 Transcript_2615/m.4482 type:complete len:311 (+) Transcript_2615:1720-2652(+)